MFPFLQEGTNITIACQIGKSRLAAFCRKKLDTLERRIEVLTRDDGKNGEWSDFHPGTNRQARPAPEEPQAADDGGLF